MSGATVGEATGQVRGSSLLLVGRVIAKAIEFAAQVLLIRYLAPEEYGALAYGLSVVLLGQTIVSLGLPETVARFLPLYREQRQYGHLAGTIALAGGAIAVLGLAVALAVQGFVGPLSRVLVGEELTVTLLLALVFLIPVEALNNLLTNLFASFARPRTIFFRTAGLAPGLKLLVVVATIVSGHGVDFFAIGLLSAGVLGLALYAGLFLRLLAEEGLLRQLRAMPVRLPIREVGTFTLAMLSSTAIWLLLQSSSTLLIGYFHGAAEVAAFAVVLPLIGLNQIVTGSFGVLYTPVAARLYARADIAELTRLYWRTALWVAVICFPAFLLTVAFARPLIGALYGPSYEPSAAVLTVLAVGYFFQAATGFNGLTLRIFRRLRYSVAIDLIAVLANLGLSLALIPTWGAFGAAVATAGTLVAHNLLKQAGLRQATGIDLFRSGLGRAYLAMAVTALGLTLLAPWLPGGVLAASVVLPVWLVVIALSRRFLDVGRTFPELSRLPFLHLLNRWGTEGDSALPTQYSALTAEVD